jgi:hypothetical protein
MYVFYVKKVFHGISVKTNEIGWFTPKNVSYEHFRFSLTDPNLLSKMKTCYLANIINFVKALKKYRAIEQNGDWTPIDIDPQLIITNTMTAQKQLVK